LQVKPTGFKVKQIIFNTETIKKLIKIIIQFEKKNKNKVPFPEKLGHFIKCDQIKNL